MAEEKIANEWLIRRVAEALLKAKAPWTSWLRLSVSRRRYAWKQAVAVLLELDYDVDRNLAALPISQRRR